MGCLGVREILSQQAVGSQVPLLPARGCSDQPKLSTGGWLCGTGNQGTQVKRSLPRSEGGLVAELDLSNL